MPLSSCTTIDNLTPIYLYLRALREEQRNVKETDEVTLADAVKKWRELAEDERRAWEAKAHAVQEQYLKDCIDREMAVGPANQADGESTTDRIEAQEGDSRKNETKGAGDATNGTSEHESARKLLLPLARVLRILRCNQVGKVTRDASFLFAKAAEQFLDRRVCEAAHVTARARRKTVSFQDFLLSLTASEHVQTLQIFIDELQPIRGEATDAPAAAASGARKKTALPAVRKKRPRPAAGTKDEQPPAAKGRRRK